MRAAAALAAALLFHAASARADEPRIKLQVEAGSEVDSNPARRTETASDPDQQSPALVARGGLRLAVGWRPAPRRSFKLATVAAAKKFVGAQQVADEDVAVLAGDLRFDARAAEQPLAWGVRLSYYDAIERQEGSAPDHDFRTGDAALSLTLLGEHAQQVSLSVGFRAFEYKPSPRYDFAGEHAQLEWRKLFEPAEDSDNPTWEIAAWYGVARRAYDDVARIRVHTCEPDNDLCQARTDYRRIDFAHTGGAELTYTGDRIYGARYLATATLSNSYGESLVRHRLELSATSEVFWSVFLTARAVVQLNLFLDPLLLTQNIDDTIEDENRNALILHATRDFGSDSAWAVEARYAFYSNEFATQTLTFRRQTAYLGLVWRL